MTLKEKSAVAVLVMVVLFLLEGAVYFLYSQDDWKKASGKYEKACRTYEREEKLIARKRQYADAYESGKAAMKFFEEDEKVDSFWNRRVEEIATTNNVFIAQSSSGKVTASGDIYELPIEVRSFEASLESLVKFLYALENSDDGLFNIRALSVQPNQAKPGYLKGSMTISCAFMRKK